MVKGEPQGKWFLKQHIISPPLNGNLTYIQSALRRMKILPVELTKPIQKETIKNTFLKLNTLQTMKYYSVLKRNKQSSHKKTQET